MYERLICDTFPYVVGYLLIHLPSFQHCRLSVRVSVPIPLAAGVLIYLYHPAVPPDAYIHVSLSLQSSKVEEIRLVSDVSAINLLTLLRDRINPSRRSPTGISTVNSIAWRGVIFTHRTLPLLRILKLCYHQAIKKLSRISDERWDQAQDAGSPRIQRPPSTHASEESHLSNTSTSQTTRGPAPGRVSSSQRLCEGAAISPRHRIYSCRTNPPTSGSKSLGIHPYHSTSGTVDGQTRNRWFRTGLRVAVECVPSVERTG